jgi:hypothetical protein
VEDAAEAEAAVEEPAVAGEQAEAAVAETVTAPPASARTSAASARNSAASAVEVEPEVKELVAEVLTRTAELSLQVRLPSRHRPVTRRLAHRTWRRATSALRHGPHHPMLWTPGTAVRVRGGGLLPLKAVPQGCSSARFDRRFRRHPTRVGTRPLAAVGGSVAPTRCEVATGGGLGETLRWEGPGALRGDQTSLPLPGRPLPAHRTLLTRSLSQVPADMAEAGGDVAAAPVVAAVSSTEETVYAAVAAHAHKLGDGPVCALVAHLRACHGHWDDLPPGQLLAAAQPPPSPGASTPGPAPPASPAGTPGTSGRRSSSSGRRGFEDIGARSPGVENGPTAMSVLGDDAALRLLRLLAEHRKTCERDGRYTEAQAASGLLVQLQTSAEKARLVDMRARHAAQRAAAEAAHVGDAEQHGAVWDAKAAEYEAMVLCQLEKLAAGAAARDADLTLELAQRAPRRLQPSKELLALRSKQEALARQGKYAEAAAVQKTADRLEAAEVTATRDAFAAEASRARAAAQAKAATEREALLQRASRGREQMRCARRQDAEQLLQRYRNVLAALEGNHKREAVQLDFFLNTQQLAGKRLSPGPGAGPGLKTTGGSPGGKLSESALVGASLGGRSASGGGQTVSPFSKSPGGTIGRSPSGSTGVATGVANMRAAVARKSASSNARAIANK